MNAYEANQLYNKNKAEKYTIKDVQPELTQILDIIKSRASYGVSNCWIAPSHNLGSRFMLFKELRRLGYEIIETQSHNGISGEVRWEKLSWRMRFTNFFTKLNRFVNIRK